MSTDYETVLDAVDTAASDLAAEPSVDTVARYIAAVLLAGPCDYTRLLSLTPLRPIPGFMIRDACAQLETSGAVTVSGVYETYRLAVS